MKRTLFITVIPLILLLSFNSSYAQKSNSILVGVEYFNGWWQQSPNKWEKRGIDWRRQYPERVPLLGQYNNQKTMDKEIETAAKYGVDFFSILWYYPGHLKENKGTDNTEHLNAGVKHFMNSTNSHKLKFMVELCNHAPFSIISDEDWRRSMEMCIDAMKHPSYLRIDGRPALKIHSSHQFFVEDNKGSYDRSKEILKGLRQQARDAGLGDILIMVGTYGTEPIDDNHFIVKTGEFDGTMQYMDATNHPQKEADYSYELLEKRSVEVRTARQDDAIPYVPYFPAGWNPRPWGDPRASFSFPNREQWNAGLKKMKRSLEESSNLGFPKKDGTVQRAFTIYAWNEFGEGGILAPTQGDKYMKLEEIRKVFEKE